MAGKSNANKKPRINPARLVRGENHKAFANATLDKCIVARAANESDSQNGNQQLRPLQFQERWHAARSTALQVLPMRKALDPRAGKAPGRYANLPGRCQASLTALGGGNVDPSHGAHYPHSPRYAVQIDRPFWRCLPAIHGCQDARSDAGATCNSMSSGPTLPRSNRGSL